MNAVVECDQSIGRAVYVRVNMFGVKDNASGKFVEIARGGD